MQLIETKNKGVAVFVNWCFYIRFERRKWFSNLWWRREGNQFTLQVFNLMLGVGLPYHWRLVECHLRDYKTVEFLDRDTALNRKSNALCKMVFSKKYYFDEMPSLYQIEVQQFLNDNVKF